MRRLLLISTSTLHGSGWLQYCRDDIRGFLGDAVQRVLFVGYAMHDLDGYAAKARQAFAAIGCELDAIHTAADERRAVEAAEALFVGGGNTFRLLTRLYEHDLADVIRARVRDGMPYVGSSAGSNVACPSIKTTNDMPIVQPPSFAALGLVPFQLNPHFLDPPPGDTHMGETRETRIREFHEMNAAPVIGLREGAMLRVEGDRMTLEGRQGGVLFVRGRGREELAAGADLSACLQTSP
jgi:dipeptidase E